MQWAWLSLLPLLFFAAEAAAQTPVVRFNSIPTPITEGQDIVVNIDAAPDFSSATNVSYTVGGNATSGSDFTAFSGTVSVTNVGFLLGGTINDDIDEDAETIIITLTAGNGYTVGSPSSVTFTINDNDTAGATITESGTPPSTSVAENGGTDDYEVWSWIASPRLP